MNRKLYILPALMLAGAFTACDNEEDPIFDEQASERLETAKKEYRDLLTSKGGLWKMEYFSNDEEKGYTMVFQFDTNGSVNISANHMWIDDQFKQERSAWEVIADDGPVLTFNTYNTLFHIFSTPENITGPNAPTNPDQNNEDVNEQGYGHNGDYEFVLMEFNEAGDSLRMLGKKRGITQWLVRLPENTDVETFLTEEKQKAENVFSKTFNKLYITDGETGEQFVLTDAYKGVMSAYPKDGDAVMQTVTANAIITSEGMRFMKPFAIPRADESKDDYVIEKLMIQPDGTLMSANGSRLTSVTPVELLCETDKSWEINSESLTGKFKEAYDITAQEALEYNASNPLRFIQIEHSVSDGDWVTVFKIQIGRNRARYYTQSNQTEGNEWSLTYHSQANDVKTLEGRYSTLRNLFEVFSTATYIISTETPLKPSVLKLVDKNDSNSSFEITLL